MRARGKRWGQRGTCERIGVESWMGKKWSDWGIQLDDSSWAKKIIVLRTEISVLRFVHTCRLFLVDGLLYENWALLWLEEVCSVIAGYLNFRDIKHNEWLFWKLCNCGAVGVFFVVLRSIVCIWSGWWF